MGMLGPEGNPTITLLFFIYPPENIAPAPKKNGGF